MIIGKICVTWIFHQIGFFLNEKIKYYLSHDEERRMIAEKGKEIVLKNHTFDNRVDTIIDSLKNLLI